jgi:hypothetical protein
MNGYSLTLVVISLTLAALLLIVLTIAGCVKIRDKSDSFYGTLLILLGDFVFLILGSAALLTTIGSFGSLSVAVSVLIIGLTAVLISAFIGAIMLDIKNM